MNPPGVSVVIPAFNAASWLARAIESALAQTMAVTEVIVVDDGSTDLTAEVAQRYESVRLVRRVANGGPAAARNSGIMIARGDWIALLDADDAWLPQKLERQLPWLQDPAIGVVHARRTIAEGVAAPPTTTFESLWAANSIIASSAVVRRSALAALGGFNEDRALVGVEDYNLWLRLAAAGWTIGTCREWLVEYTPAPGHLSSHRRERFAAELANVAAIGEALWLSHHVVETKRLQVLEMAGGELLFARDLEGARGYFRTLLREQVSLAAASGWLLTFLPRPILNLRRRIRETGVLGSAGPESTAG